MLDEPTLLDPVWCKFDLTATFERPVVERLRRLCLALPETTETSSWGHPNFRAGKKTFCTFEIVASRPSIAFRVSPTDATLLASKKAYFATPYGRGSWVSMWIDGKVDWTQVARLVEAGYRIVANKRMTAALDLRSKP